MKNLGVAMVGGHGRREKDDFYPTPPEATLALLPLIQGWPKHVWEPCCGDGAISRVLESAGYTAHSTDLVYRGYGTGDADFFQCEVSVAETIVTNPPFKEAGAFIKHAHTLGVIRMALLLKMTFWNAAARRKVWDTWRPSVIHPLTWRLDFDGRGAPTMDCMWCLWEPGRGREVTRFEPIRRPVMLETESAEALLA